MDFQDVLKLRRSVRSYKPDDISGDKLERLAEAVEFAPSACNLQPWSFRVVFDQDVREKIGAVYSRPWLLEAPAIVVALGNGGAAWKRLEGNSIVDVDVAIAMEHLVLAAANEGLGTCWICAYEVAAMNKALNILAPWSVVAITPLGYPNETPETPPRKPRKEIFAIIRSQR